MHHKIISSSFAIVLACVSLSACDNSNNSDDNKERTQTSDINADNTNKANNATTSETDSTIDSSDSIELDTTLATVTLTATLDSVKIPLQINKTLDSNVQSCVNTIPEDFALQEVQAFFTNNFSPSELEALNSFYKTEEAIAYTNYGRDQVLMAYGVALEKPTKKPKRKQMKKVDEFSKSPLGQKYIDITKADDDESLAKIVMPLLNKELKKCGIDI